METLVEAFDAAQDDVPTLFIAWTIKGFGLPFAGHKDNHAGLMNPTQMAACARRWACARAMSGSRSKASATMRGRRRGVARAQPRIAREKRSRSFGSVKRSAPPRAGRRGAIDAGRVRPDPARSVESRRRARRPHRHHLARRHRLDQPRRVGEPARPVPPQGDRRRICQAKDCVRAKMGAQQQGPAHRARHRREQPVPDARRRRARRATCSAQRLFPIGTLYDPFIARGLDALNYACYQDARFLLVATPSGITLGPEGGAHQSINPPLIALGQPGLRHYEPAFADELAAMMEEAFRLIDDPAGESTYLRLSTRCIRQVERSDDGWREGALAGGYWLREPGADAEAAIVAMGAVMPEALAAWEELKEDVPGLGLLAVTSPDLLHRGWTAAQAARWGGERRAEPHRAALSPLVAQRRPRHHRRRRARVAVVARRSARPARRAARRREIRPDRQPRRPLCRLPSRRRGDHRSGGRDFAPERMNWSRFATGFDRLGDSADRGASDTKFRSQGSRRAVATLDPGATAMRRIRADTARAERRSRARRSAAIRHRSQGAACRPTTRSGCASPKSSNMPGGCWTHGRRACPSDPPDRQPPHGRAADRSTSPARSSATSRTSSDRATRKPRSRHRNGRPQGRLMGRAQAAQSWQALLPLPYSSAHGRALFRRVEGRRPRSARDHADGHRDRQSC